MFHDKAWNKAIMYALDSSGVKGKDWTITKKLNENLTASTWIHQTDTHKRQHTPRWNTIGPGIR